MSIRTIIEINHDFLHELEDDPRIMADLLDQLCAPVRFLSSPNGIRILAQRHHTEKLSLEVE